MASMAINRYYCLRNFGVPEMAIETNYLTRKRAAEYLHSIGCPISPATLAKYACYQKGPPYTRVGWRIVRYLKEDLRQWAEKVTVRVG